MSLDVGGIPIAIGDSVVAVSRRVRARFYLDSGDVRSGSRDWVILGDSESIGGFTERNGRVVEVSRLYVVDSTAGLVDRYSTAINDMRTLLKKDDLGGCKTTHEMGSDRSGKLTLYEFIVTKCGSHEVELSLPRRTLASRDFGGSHVRLSILAPREN